MDFNTFKNIVIAKCGELGITEYELYYQAAESTSVSAFQHEINQFTSSIEGGVCFRCIVGGRMGYASTEELSEAAAAAIVARAADNAAVLKPRSLCSWARAARPTPLWRIPAWLCPLPTR